MKKERFSIRKTSRGAVSACIAVLGLFALSLSAQDVQADSQPAEALPTATSSGEVLGDQEEATSETIEIASPVTYVADETKAVGETEVVQPGQDGKLVITGELPDKTVTLEAPSETVVAVGTKPLIEEVLTEKAETEYVANEQLEAGTTRVVQEGQDGARVTTTSHKVVEKPALLLNQTDNYEGQTVYTIDNTKELASDKVVIDEAAVRAELAGLTTDEEWVKVLNDSRSILSHYNTKFQGYFGSTAQLSDAAQSHLEQNYPTAERYADIKAAAIRHQAAVDYIKANYSGEALVDFIAQHFDKNQFTEVTEHYSLVLYAPDKPQLPQLHKREVSDTYGGINSLGVFKRYLSILKKDGILYEVTADGKIKVDGELYSISPAGLRNEVVKSFEDQSVEEITEQFDKTIEQFQTAYETHTTRYNQADRLPIVYESKQMTAEEKTWFEEQLASLPKSLLKNLVKVTITDENLSLPGLPSAAGYARYSNNEIKLDYSIMGSTARLLKVFLHELAHVIDNNAAQISTGDEFRKIYYTYFNTPLEVDASVRPYYRDYTQESFAEFFSDYIMTRHFPEYQPVKFYNLGGDEGEKGILTLRSYDWGYSQEDIAKNRANYEKYYNDPAAYSPMKAAEWWFAKLYNQLFEQPTKAEVVVNQVKTEVLAVKPKIVEVGTKPLVVREETAYTSREEQSADLPLGQRQVVQKGQIGIVEKTTTYELVDKKTGQVASKTVSQVIQDMVEEIIAVGTKIVEAEPIKTDKPKTDDVVTPPTKTEDKEPNRPNQQAEGDKVKEDKVVKEPKQPTATGKQEEQPAKVLTSSPKPVPSGEKPTTYSRRQESQAKQTLPATGDRLTMLAIAGFGLTVLGLAGLKRPRS